MGERKLRCVSSEIRSPASSRARTTRAAEARSPYPKPTSHAVSAAMRGNRKTGNRPEVQLRSALHRRGLRFRKNLAIRGDGWVIRPDIVFPRLRLAVFLDGCFWHACP